MLSAKSETRLKPCSDASAPFYFLYECILHLCLPVLLRQVLFFVSPPSATIRIWYEHINFAYRVVPSTTTRNPLHALIATAYQHISRAYHSLLSSISTYPRTSTHYQCQPWPTTLFYGLPYHNRLKGLTTIAYQHQIIITITCQHLIKLTIGCQHITIPNAIGYHLTSGYHYIPPPIKCITVGYH